MPLFTSASGFQINGGTFIDNAGDMNIIHRPQAMSGQNIGALEFMTEGPSRMTEDLELRGWYHMEHKFNSQHPLGSFSTMHSVPDFTEGYHELFHDSMNSTGSEHPMSSFASVAGDFSQISSSNNQFGLALTGLNPNPLFSTHIFSEETQPPFTPSFHLPTMVDVSNLGLVGGPFGEPEPPVIGSVAGTNPRPWDDQSQEQKVSLQIKLLNRLTIALYHPEFFMEDRKQYIYILHGLGGGGKTQIGLKFINDSTCFSDKFFLDGSTAETIDTGLKSIALAKNLTKTQDWLLFYDNTDDPKINLNPFLPQCNHGNIIITTRNPGLCVYAGANSAVSDMEQTDAVELLLKSAAQESSLANKRIAAEIVKELCYLPLAIVQAGAFISQSGGLDSYLNIYMKNRAQLLSEKPTQSHDNYTWTVYTTWQMSFDKLSPLAATFLQLCSFLHWDGISEEIFSRAAAYRFQLAIPSREALEKPLGFLEQSTDPEGKWDTLGFLKVTNEIKAYSLMSFNPEKKMFSIHPLVHSWSQTTIKDPNSYHSIMASIMGMSIYEIPSEHEQLAALGLISHIDCLRHGNQQVIVDFGAQYGTIYSCAGRYEEAKELDLAVLERRKHCLGDDHPDTLWAIGNLASIYRSLGQFYKAKELEVLVLGDDHPDTLWAMGNLATTYGNLGKFQQAGELQVIVLEKRKQILGDDHLDTLLAMGNLASTYHYLGKFHKAEELEIAVLEKQKQVLGDNHPDTLWTMGSLASTYQNLGKFHRAEELKVVVLEKRKQDLGNDHPDTLKAMGNLASTYRHLGEFHRAEELNVVVLEKQKKVLGDDHPDTLQAMGNLALTYWHLSKFQQAEELQVAVLEKRKPVLGDDHPDTLRDMSNLASTYHSLGELHKAEELKVVALEKRKQILGDDHPDTLQAMGNLAATYNRLGKFQQAEELEIVVLEKRKHFLGNDHPDTLRAMGNLGCTYHELGEFQKAEELQVVVLEKRKMFLGANHPDTLRTMRYLASTYRSLGKLSEAEEPKNSMTIAWKHRDN
ncbi:hypothetical protein B0H13DRAFT_2568163 [Mycena leptocephala]|nr:hypothetical protein B0H13DRAFT_2568163 [Mycena leptocephala]